MLRELNMNIQPVGSPVTAKLEDRQVQPAAAANTAVTGQPAPAVSPDELSSAVKKLNESMLASAQSLEFSIGDDNKQIIVKVVDKNTREVLRQMPSKEALEIAKSLDQMRGLLIRQTA